jgi:cytochrome P450
MESRLRASRVPFAKTTVLDVDGAEHCWLRSANNPDFAITAIPGHRST